MPVLSDFFANPMVGIVLWVLAGLVAGVAFVGWIVERKRPRILDADVRLERLQATTPAWGWGVSPATPRRSFAAVHCYANLMGRLIARQDVTIDQIYVELFRRRRFRKSQIIARAFDGDPHYSPNIKPIGSGVTLRPGEVLSLGKLGAHFTCLNERPLHRVDDQDGLFIRLAVETLHPRGITRLAIPNPPTPSKAGSLP